MSARMSLKRGRQRTDSGRFNSVLACGAVLGAVGLVALASPSAARAETTINVDFNAQFRGTLEIYPTVRGDPNADPPVPPFSTPFGTPPLLSRDFVSGEHVLESVTSAAHDLRKVIRESTLAAFVDSDASAVVVDGGEFTSPDLSDFLVGRLGVNGQVSEPVLSSSTSEVFVLVEMSAFISAGALLPPVGSTLNFVNGLCDIPGIYAGGVPMGFDVGLGVLNSEPFNGTLDVIGSAIYTAVPEPGSLALLGLGALTLGSLTRRRG